MTFILAALNIFFLSFQKFNYEDPHVAIFGFILFTLLSFLNQWVYVSWKIWEVFNKVSSSTFSAPSSFSFWLRLWWHKYLIFCYNPMGPWGSIHFVSFSLCFLDLVISVVFQFTDTPIPTFCCWFYPLNFSFQLLSISVLKFLPFFFGSLYFSGTLYFFPEAFYLHICFNFISIYSLKYFIIVALKSWSNNSNMSVILMLAPTDCLFFPWFEIFLDLVRQVMFSWNLHFSCYVMRLWISFKPVLTGFLCHHSGRGRGSCR